MRVFLVTGAGVSESRITLKCLWLVEPKQENLRAEP
jgi:hypothetical protein